MLKTCTRKELKEINASDFKQGDMIDVSKYTIHISYGITKEGKPKYKIPSLCSWIEITETHRILDCTAGIERPYYIDDFLNR